ncbi:hypothetical protein N431DRAFT_350598 [Stipitochalara longipes BDJ]|nr:hypothetical protein N431DRAFT_350598 [Stipitochalara longipes BDJ]
MSGYERLAGLMTKHSEVATFQRFDFLNTLNILYLQAELVHLEQELRDSMREDLESGNNHPSQTPNSTGSFYFLANMHNSSTWDIMLKARDKLKEYNEAILKYKEMKSEHSPNPCDLEFLRRWFEDKKMGNLPLIGQDSTLWEASEPPDLIAIRARRAEDPLGTLFLSRVFLWWHNCIGHRIKKPADEETRYFEYEDRYVLRVANIFGSIISSALLVRSIVVLYFVDSILIRLGIVAAFTQVFSLVLILATNARKIEVFAATAA